jgi:hypothetical protein
MSRPRPVRAGGHLAVRTRKSSIRIVRKKVERRVYCKTARQRHSPAGLTLHSEDWGQGTFQSSINIFYQNYKNNSFYI